MSNEENRPDEEHPAKPDTLSDIRKPSWRHIARRTLFETVDDQVTDLAAALTYYAVLSIFPALIALVSLLGLVGDAQTTVDQLLQIMERFVPADAMGQLEPVVSNLVNNRGAGLGLLIGLLGALWTASNYVNAFARAMNRIYEIDEGRPFWKLRPLLYGLTAVLLVITAAASLMLVITGPLARAIGDVIGLGSAAVTLWNVLKWPLLLILVIVAVALLYYFTPNVRQPKFRWVSVGAIIAILVALVASALFGLYVANFGNYAGTYGALAGVIIFLLWLWLLNVALLIGAEVDAELERGRQLQAGIAAEQELQLPASDDRNIKKRDDKRENLVRSARRLRHTAGQDDDVKDDAREPDTK